MLLRLLYVIRQKLNSQFCGQQLFTGTFCRHRQPSSLSEAELVTDSEAVSETTENSADGAGLSETELDGTEGELHPAAEKIATVCNEIKQRFQTDRLNTDDENVI